MLDTFESISPTAIMTSYPRIFTDIPYEKESYNWLSKNCDKVNEVKLNKMLAPEIEARYKLINKLLDTLEIKQIFEIAAGYSSRGLIYSKNDFTYVEMDLESVTKNKVKLLNDIDTINNKLHIVSGNALNYDDFKKCEQFFDAKKELAIINEGLLRYLTFEEKKIVATNIFNYLTKFGGAWITCDITPKNFIKNQNISNPKLNSNLNNITQRNNLNDRFENEEHIKEFFKEIGFKNIEIHKFIEVKDDLKSLKMLNIDDNEFDELLASGIVAIFKI